MSHDSYVASEKGTVKAPFPRLQMIVTASVTELLCDTPMKKLRTHRKHRAHVNRYPSSPQPHEARACGHEDSEINSFTKVMSCAEPKLSGALTNPYYIPYNEWGVRM